MSLLPFLCSGGGRESPVHSRRHPQCLLVCPQSLRLHGYVSVFPREPPRAGRGWVGRGPQEGWDEVNGAGECRPECRAHRAKPSTPCTSWSTPAPLNHACPTRGPGGPVAPHTIVNSLKHGDYARTFFSSSPVVSAGVHYLWPQTVLPLWPRDATRLDSPALNAGTASRVP